MGPRDTCCLRACVGSFGARAATELKKTTRACMQVLRGDPGNWVALSTEGQRLLARGRWREAAALLRRAVSAAPWHVEPALLLARLLRGHRAEAVEEDGQAAPAREPDELAGEGPVEMLERVLTVEPSCSEALKLYGDMLWESGEWEGAHAMLTAAVSHDPLDYESVLKLVAPGETRHMHANTCMCACPFPPVSSCTMCTRACTWTYTHAHVSHMPGAQTRGFSQGQGGKGVLGRRG